MKKNNKKKSKTLNIIKKIVGLIFIIIGIFGLFLPFLQGVLLVLTGLAMYYNKSIIEVKEYASNLIKKIKKWRNK